MVKPAFALTLALLVAGCATTSPEAGPTLPALADYQGCNLRIPDGRPLACQPTAADDAAPSWMLATCYTEDTDFGDWLAIAQWTAHNQFGMAAVLTPGRQAVMALETNGRQHLLHLPGTGQAGFVMQDFARVDGFVMTFEEQVTLTVNGEPVPVKVHWQSVDGNPIATYEAEGGHWFHNVTMLRFGNFEFPIGFGSFNITGSDFTLVVKRTIYQNLGVGIGNGHYAGRPCFGPGGPGSFP